MSEAHEWHGIEMDNNALQNERLSNKWEANA